MEFSDDGAGAIWFDRALIGVFGCVFTSVLFFNCSIATWRSTSEERVSLLCFAKSRSNARVRSWKSSIGTEDDDMCEVGGGYDTGWSASVCQVGQGKVLL